MTTHDVNPQESPREELERLRKRVAVLEALEKETGRPSAPMRTNKKRLPQHSDHVSHSSNTKQTVFTEAEAPAVVTAAKMIAGEELHGQEFQKAHETAINSVREELAASNAQLKQRISNHNVDSESLNRFRAILDTTTDFVGIADPNGYVLYVNRAGRAMLGTDDHEDLSQEHIRNHHPETEARRILKEGIPVAKRDGVWSAETIFLARDGRKIPVSQVLLAHKLPDGEVEYFSTIVRDISHRRRLEKAILEIRERELRRFGQDLHDDLSQQLVSIAFAVQALEQEASSSSWDGSKEVQEIAGLLDNTISWVRGLARGLYPIRIMTDGLASALADLASNAEKRFQVSCCLEQDPRVEISDPIPATHLYRIAQEALSNAIRHGQANRVVIGLVRSKNDRVLSIQDNGMGFSEGAEETDGMGLLIMRARAASIGASLDIERNSPSGTRVMCSLGKDCM